MSDKSPNSKDRPFRRLLIERQGQCRIRAKRRINPFPFLVVRVKQIIASWEKLGLHRIQRAYCCGDIFFHYVCIDFGSLDVRVSHELLEHADIDAVFKHVGGE